MEDQLAYKLCQPLQMAALNNTLNQQVITKVCSEITCDKKPLICSNEDLQQHSDHTAKLTEIEAFVSSFSTEMSRLANQNIRLYQEFMQNKENVSLLQLLEHGEPQLKKMEDLVIRQKTEIAFDITNLQEKIMIIIQQIKEDNLKRLDQFLEQYKKSFATLKENIDSFFLLSRKNFYYSNQNTFQMKLASLGTPEAQTLIQTLKHHLNISKQLSQSSGNATPLQMLTDLQTLARFLLQMTNSPPNYDKLQNPTTNMLESVVKEVGSVLSSVVSTRLYLPVNNKETSQVGTGENNLQLQLDARNYDRFYLKPTKKYQIDTQISCVLAMTEQLFALGSQNDSVLRIFDTAQRKISVFNYHTGNIVYLERIQTQEMNSKQFVSLGSDRMAIVWSIDDFTQSVQPRVFRKIQLTSLPISALDMKDNTHIAFSDQNRDITICNFYTQKLGTNNTKHLNRINGLTLLKKGEKFLSYSSDSIINIWRLMKQGSQQDPILICDQTLHDPLYGSISQVFITTQWNNHAVIVSNEGSVKIFDLSKNCIVFSKFGNKKLNSTYLESVLLEESDKKINPPVWLLTFSFNDNIATQHHLTMSPYAMHSQDLKMEHQLSAQFQLSAKHKVQIYQLQQTATSGSGRSGTLNLMFVGENSQELLVYEIKGK